MNSYQKIENIIDKIKIALDVSIKDSLKKIDEAAMATLFVCDDKGVLLGSLTDGDIRRMILKTGNLEEKVYSCYNRNPFFVVEGKYTLEEVRKNMVKKAVEAVPVLDETGKITDVLFWVDIFENGKEVVHNIAAPVVLMAGGKGERLGPFTKIFPKSLIPIGEKPIIEIIIEKFRKYQVENFYVTLNYKGEMIKNYLEGIERNYKINYVWEKEFLGTAGSIKLLPFSLEDNFIVSNCDIIVDTNYSELLDFHKENKNALTVVGAIQHHRLPYGVIHFEEEGRIKKIQEKPEFDFMVNTGMYVLSKKVINYIPDNKHFDMTNLIELLLNVRENVGIYPVSQKSYIDIGRWEEYQKAIEKVNFLSKSNS